MANKSDRETAESARALADWWQRWGGERRKVSAIRGNIDLALLDEPRRNTAPLPASAEHAHRHPATSGLAALSWRNTSAGAAISTMAGLSGLRLDLRRGDGFDTIGLLEWAGWRQWGALKA